MNIQRIRNLTTGRLHTTMDDIYIDIESLTGEKGVMTHMLPNMCTALKPYLRGRLIDSRLWDGKYDPSHQGEIIIEPMSNSEKLNFLERYDKCKSNMIDPVIRKICDKLEALDFTLLYDKHSARIKFIDKETTNTTNVFVEADSDGIVVYISGIVYNSFNEESFNLLLKVFNASVYKKKENMQAIEDDRNKRIMETSIKNILNAAL